MKDAIPMTPYLMASRFLGLKEAPGAVHNSQVLAMLQLVSPTVSDDETAWCSAFVNYVAWLMGCSMSKSLAARSWLKVGVPVGTVSARQGFHVVVLQRGEGQQPGPETISAPGHVGFFAGFEGDNVVVLGGNQSNSVSLARFPKSRILGIREI